MWDWRRPCWGNCATVGFPLTFNVFLELKGQCGDQNLKKWQKSEENVAKKLKNQQKFAII